jgi:DME family drug/metabolite transporter
MILFVIANKLTTSANAIFLQSTAPLYLLLLGPFVLREPVRKIDLAVIATVAAGTIFLLMGSQAAGSTSPDPHLGNLLALGAGAAWALTITGFRWIGKRSHDTNATAAIVIAGNLVAFVACLPMAIPVETSRVADVWVLLYLGVFQISVAYVFLTRALHEVSGLEAATLLLVEPVFNPVWTWIVQGERPGVTVLTGGFLIIGAAFAGTAWRLKFTHISQLQDITTPD